MSRFPSARSLAVACLIACAFAATARAQAEIDHAAVLRSLDEATLARGQNLYEGYCAACHGADGEALLPMARSFNRDSLKFGRDPYSMWRTVTEGRGMMTAQTWISPEDRYAIIQYIRERIIRPANPGQYFELTADYLDGLPRPAPAENAADQHPDSPGHRPG